jgi:hypothetical protein
MATETLVMNSATGDRLSLLLALVFAKIAAPLSAWPSSVLRSFRRHFCKFPGALRSDRTVFAAPPGFLPSGPRAATGLSPGD